MLAQSAVLSERFRGVGIVLPVVAASYISLAPA